MNIYSIYKATCIITDQCYIGFDSDWPNRKKSHKRESKKDNNIKFYNAIKKYGVCIKSTRYDFYNTYKINRGGVSDMINQGITYKDWKIL